MMKFSPVQFGRSQVFRWAFILVAVLPFQLGLWHHLISAGSSATGLLGYDAPYYLANGREIFERGNGFAHPNPYDPDPASPVIYFHWLTWVFGFGIKVLHFDPGFFYAVIGVVAAIVGSALTLRVVETVLPSSRWRFSLFLLTMWGGGALCLGAMAANFVNQEPLFGDLFVIDGPAGWWFPNWGRNFVLPAEAVYHVLVLVAWLGILRRRWIPAFIGVGAIAATHPFSGAQQLIIFCAWLGYLLWHERTRGAFARAMLGSLMFAAFAGYYFWFLDSFPAYRHLQEVWGHAWTASLPFLLLSSGPVMALALWRLGTDRWRMAEGDRFLLLAGCLTLLLMKHDWFIAARQPLHFSRGYNWLPFWLVALPKLQDWAERLIAGRRPLAIAMGALAGGLIVLDNTAFVVREWREGEGSSHHLDVEQREMFSWMDKTGLPGVLLCADPRMSYLSATYTCVRPYIGHLANTPYAVRRWQEISAWQRRGEIGSWFSTIDYILIDRQHPPLASTWQREWREIHSNSGYILLALEK